MSDLQVMTSTGGTSTLDEAAVEQFRAALRGDLLQSADQGYDEARSLWNAMIDRRPALIARCAGPADVITCVNFAREHGVKFSVRGAGHNIAGSAANDGGLMIDLSPMNWVTVDPAGRTARVGPGATLADVDHETQAFGLAIPTGINSTTGISGLTLGGGFGWLSRKYGMTVDNLLAADVVTAEGNLVTASEEENADLFWGLRGGGGNFGIVTSFQFQLHEFGPEVLSGLIVHPGEDAARVLDYYRDFVAQAPDDLTCWCVLRKAPPLPFLAEDVHGTDVLVIALLFTGEMAEGERLLQPLRAFGKPHAEVIGPNPYAGWQQAFDPLLTPGARNYWKSHNFTGLADGLLEQILDGAASLPTGYSEIFLAQMGGASGRVPAGATAYAHRDIAFVMNVHTRWEDPAQDDDCVAWARGFFDATAPFATGGVYVNFVSEATGRENSAFGQNYDRLVQLKNKYDPGNFFRANQNVKPSA